jgi:lipopolysaccharide transport system ATP-binding protein
MSAIRAEQLSKRYTIGVERHRPDTLRDLIVESATRMLGPRGRLRAADATIWALRDVSFEVQRGEVVGIIGRNGAGKSTLLKILSRITEPTQGRAEIKGRVGSLLEVGTGFHPDLTGRENIYLNGAILGMRRGEINRKFDEIVDFAEIGNFIETPVKRYSSGMYVRLAFAVAAHLEPEVLLVDEVLSVGDFAFQRKCLGRMGEVAGGGRTVLFVSHNMAAVRSLCRRSILIEGGAVRFDGDSDSAIDLYLAGSYEEGVDRVDTTGLHRRAIVAADNGLRISEVALNVHEDSGVAKTGEPLTVTLTFDCTEPQEEVVWDFYIETLDGLRLIEVRSVETLGISERLEPGRYSISGTLPTNPLAAGRYRLGVSARDARKPLDWIPDVLQFAVEDARQFESLYFEQTFGIFQTPSTWEPPLLLEPTSRAAEVRP